MKIFCIIQCTNLGGMEQSTLLLLDELQKMGHQTELLSLNEISDLGELLKARRIPASSIGYHGVWGWRSFLPLRRLLKTKQADALIMVGHNLMAMLALGRLAEGNRLLCIHFHHKGVRPDWVWRLIYRVGVACFNRIVYPSHFIMDEALKIGPFLKDAPGLIADPIPPPIDLPEKVGAVGKKQARVGWGLAPGTKVIGNAGWLIPRKRWDIFLQVAQRVIKEIPEARFLIAGGGPQLPRLQALATSLGIADQVLWLGWQDNLRNFYHSLDVMLFNSDWDAMGRTPLEAMSYGIPVVASVLHGGLGEIIDNDACGFLIDTHDVSRLAGKVVEILSHPTLAETMSEQSRAKIEEVCSPQAHTLRVLKLLQRQPLDEAT